MDIIWAGVISAVAVLFVLFKLDIRKVLGYDVYVDVTFTLGLAYMFSGTYSGMLAAIIGGAILSLVLFILRRILGYKQLEISGLKLVWREYFP